jgi:hypothetical protein
MKEKAIALLLSIIANVDVGGNLLSNNLLNCSFPDCCEGLGFRALIFGSSNVEER